MAKPAPRGILRMILKNFIDSFKPKQLRGTFKGSDYYGNKYYEISGSPSVGYGKPRRWFEPPIKDDFMQEMPAEWEAWLRGRRGNAPTEAEIMKSLSLIQTKKINAMKVNKLAGEMTPMQKGFETFPKRPDFETVPGKLPKEK